MRVLHPRRTRCIRCGYLSRLRYMNTAVWQNRLQLFGRYTAWPKHMDFSIYKLDDRRLDANARCSTIDNAANSTVQIISHMRSQRRTRST
ncbi:hypothetical protein D3C84_1086010 [compost metagenome]